ncbi:MAG: hypothetical protein AB1705_26200, partial [Verrucomicrobiota bacterium]
GGVVSSLAAQLTPATGKKAPPPKERRTLEARFLAGVFTFPALLRQPKVCRVLALHKKAFQDDRLRALAWQAVEVQGDRARLDRGADGVNKFLAWLDGLAVTEAETLELAEKLL